MEGGLSFFTNFLNERDHLDLKLIILKSLESVFPVTSHDLDTNPDMIKVIIDLAYSSDDSRIQKLAKNLIEIWNIEDSPSFPTLPQKRERNIEYQEPSRKRYKPSVDKENTVEDIDKLKERIKMVAENGFSSKVERNPIFRGTVEVKIPSNVPDFGPLSVDDIREKKRLEKRRKEQLEWDSKIASVTGKQTTIDDDNDRLRTRTSISEFSPEREKKHNFSDDSDTDSSDKEFECPMPNFDAKPISPPILDIRTNKRIEDDQCPSWNGYKSETPKIDVNRGNINGTQLENDFSQKEQTKVSSHPSWIDLESNTEFRYSDEERNDDSIRSPKSKDSSVLFFEDKRPSNYKDKVNSFDKHESPSWSGYESPIRGNDVPMMDTSVINSFDEKFYKEKSPETLFAPAPEPNRFSDISANIHIEVTNPQILQRQITNWKRKRIQSVIKWVEPEELTLPPPPKYAVVNESMDRSIARQRKSVLLPFNCYEDLDSPYECNEQICDYDDSDIMNIPLN